MNSALKPTAKHTCLMQTLTSNYHEQYYHTFTWALSWQKKVSSTSSTIKFALYEQCVKTDRQHTFLISNSHFQFLSHRWSQQLPLPLNRASREGQQGRNLRAATSSRMPWVAWPTPRTRTLITPSLSATCSAVCAAPGKAPGPTMSSFRPSCRVLRYRDSVMLLRLPDYNT